ncbi:MAG: ROK family transcriptional regulator [Firmicutes bacterium HGW-Firmicutes-7]|nr:MAG: ROK family transcriptional regulator [Firmicutes bacterium HGW-Firmicutes-7]
MIIKDKKKYAIGVDIGGTKILLMIANKFGKVIHKKKVDSTGDLNDILKIIDVFLDEVNIGINEIVGMGIGVPGEINSLDGIVRVSVQMGWKDTNIKEVFSDRYAFPVYIKNDVNFSALGERWIGNGDNSDNLVYISIGTGVGGAIIANGHLIEGYNFSAGELGYIVDKDDFDKESINDLEGFGSLERKISGHTLTQKVSEMGISPEELFIEFKKGEQSAVDIIEVFIRDLSIAIANLVSTLNPEFVIIGGGVSESMHCIIDQIITCVNRLTIFPTNVKLSKLGGEAGAYGCIYYVFFEATEDTTSSIKKVRSK